MTGAPLGPIQSHRGRYIGMGGDSDRDRDCEANSDCDTDCHRDSDLDSDGAIGSYGFLWKAVARAAALSRDLWYAVLVCVCVCVCVCVSIVSRVKRKIFHRFPPRGVVSTRCLFCLFA